MFLKKLIYPLALTILFVLQLGNVFGQKKLNSDSLQLFYILDEAWYPKSRVTKPYKRDDSPNYIQVINNEAIIVGKFLGIGGRIDLYMYGNIDGLKKSKSKNGEQIIAFYIRGRRRSVGYLRSVEIIFKNENEIKIHFFNKLGSWESYLTAHKASKDEIIEIKKYWEERRGYTSKKL